MANLTVRYEQASIVSNMHNLPRFGHSSSISSLMSHDRLEQSDYVRGILSFAIFIGTFFLVWFAVLVLLKLGPSDIVGCAGGGGAVDIAQLRKDRFRKSVRRRRILRAWRLQWAFVLASISVPAMTVFWARNGLDPFLKSLEVAQKINDDIETIAYRGISIASALIETRQQLEGNFTKSFDLSKSCPNADNSPLIRKMGLPTIAEVVKVGLKDLDTALDGNIHESHDALTQLVKITRTIDKSIDFSYSNDWMLKFYLMVLNVINGFFLIGIFLTRNDIDHQPYQNLASYVLVPVFATLVSLSTIVAGAFAAVTMLNADFCSGGLSPGSPEGTIQEVIFQRGTQESLTFQLFMYYMEGCINDNPIQFLADTSPLIQHTIDALELAQLNVGAYSFEVLDRECKGDMTPLVGSLPNLIEMLEIFLANVEGAWELTGCHRISPILRKILHGATCLDSVESLSWLLFCTLAISVLGFVMLSVRAALYNPILRAPKRIRRNEREKEFDEYKDFMSKYYNDADSWKLNPKKGDGFELPRGETFETVETRAEISEGLADEVVSDYSSDSSIEYEIDEQSMTSSFIRVLSALRCGTQPEGETSKSWIRSEKDKNHDIASRSLLGKVHGIRSDDDYATMFSRPIEVASPIMMEFNDKIVYPTAPIEVGSPLPSTMEFNDDSFTTPHQRRIFFAENCSPRASIRENQKFSSPLSAGKSPPKTPVKLIKSYGRTKGAKKMI